MGPKSWDKNLKEPSRLKLSFFEPALTLFVPADKSATFFRRYVTHTQPSLSRSTSHNATIVEYVITRSCPRNEKTRGTPSLTEWEQPLAPWRFAARCCYATFCSFQFNCHRFLKQRFSSFNDFNSSMRHTVCRIINMRYFFSLDIYWQVQYSKWGLVFFIR